MQVIYTYALAASYFMKAMQRLYEARRHISVFSNLLLSWSTNASEMKSIHYALHNVHSRRYVAEHERSLIIYVMQISSKIIIVTVRQAATVTLTAHKRKIGNDE